MWKSQIIFFHAQFSLPSTLDFNKIPIYSQKRRCWEKAHFFQIQAACSATFVYYLSTIIMNIHNKPIIMHKPVVAPLHPLCLVCAQYISPVNSYIQLSFSPVFPLLIFYRDQCCGQSCTQRFCLHRLDLCLETPVLLCVPVYVKRKRYLAKNFTDFTAWHTCTHTHTKYCFHAVCSLLLLQTGEARGKYFLIYEICW